ncbi:hypothetical protein Scep_019564 [Stephania cephalantha]|uniref:Uncharacterized protein n=1 Tax=Stephania cephalantha TaxID=152367 RepID=A0AAP0NNF8_9MAGN
MQTNSSETPPTVNELYLHLHTVNHDGMTFIDTRSERFYDRLQRRRLELTQATPDQPVDDEAVYLNVADPSASTSQMPKMVPRAEFDIVADQLQKVMAFMHQQFGMTMDGAGISQPQPPPPPPPHDQQQPPQIDPADPPQQGDNVERETQEWLTRDEHLDVTFACLRYAHFAVEMFVKVNEQRLQELALSLALKCLSFDFVGTSLDESSEEFGTVLSAWRPVLEDPSNLQIFFDYYAITKPPISKEVAELIGFQRCMHSCLEYLEAVPWVGDEEEEKVLLWLL